MNIDNLHIDILITRFLSGEATPIEINELEYWMEVSEDNKKYFEKIVFVNKQSIASHKIIKVDVDKAWNKLHQQMYLSKVKTPTTQIIRFNAPFLLKIAAGLALILGFSIWLYIGYHQNHSIKGEIAVASHDSTKNSNLPDSSHVFLNKSSSIAYNSQYGKKNREVSLKGEAYFNVRHSAELPFKVKTDETFVEDIGTAFNIKTDTIHNLVEVYVDNGEVKFFTTENPGISLIKGETGIYDKSAKTFKKQAIQDNNVLSYKTKLFIFTSDSLTDVVSRLNAVYDKKIKLGNNVLNQCTITVKFDQEDIGSIAGIIAETLGLQVYKTDDGYVLQGNGCVSN